MQLLLIESFLATLLVSQHATAELLPSQEGEQADDHTQHVAADNVADYLQDSFAPKFTYNPEPSFAYDPQPSYTHEPEPEYSYEPSFSYDPIAMNERRAEMLYEAANPTAVPSAFQTSLAPVRITSILGETGTAAIPKSLLSPSIETLSTTVHYMSSHPGLILPSMVPTVVSGGTAYVPDYMTSKSSLNNPKATDSPSTSSTESFKFLDSTGLHSISRQTEAIGWTQITGADGQTGWAVYTTSLSSGMLSYIEATATTGVHASKRTSSTMTTKRKTTTSTSIKAASTVTVTAAALKNSAKLTTASPPSTTPLPTFSGIPAPKPKATSAGTANSAQVLLAFCSAFFAMALAFVL